MAARLTSQAKACLRRLAQASTVAMNARPPAVAAMMTDEKFRAHSQSFATLLRAASGGSLPSDSLPPLD